MDNIEDADIIVDLSGGKLIVQKLRERIKQLQAKLDKAEAEKKKLEGHIQSLQECDDTATEVINEMDAELDKHRWIPVGERLPKKEKKENNLGYLITDGCRFHKAYYEFTTMRWCCNHAMNRITHWKPITLPSK